MIDVYVVYVYEECDARNCDSSQRVVSAVYTTKQTAQQHADRHGGEVSTEHLLTKVREW